MPTKPELSGLTDAQALQKLQDFGPNQIVDKSSSTIAQIFIRQFKGNFVLYLLIIAAVISFFVHEEITAYTILVVIGISIGLGFFQEYKAEKEVTALKGMIMPTSYVIRGGEKKEISSENLVPQDLVILGIGEKIPADGVIIEGSNVGVNESVLTGESQEISKKICSDPDVCTDEHLLFMGTYIVSGRCVMQVEHTGMNTKFGKIAGLIASTEKSLPLEDKINKISKYMVVVATIISVITGALVLLRAPEINTVVLIETLVLVIALCVSAFPSGFPVVLSSTLAVGAMRMAKKNAIVSRMSTIETLGEVTVICSDKTGTITKGEMSAKLIYSDDRLYEVSGVGYSAKGDITENGVPVKISEHPNLNLLVKSGVFCNDAIINRKGTDEDLEFKVKGTPTEAALLVLGAKCGIYKETLNHTRFEEMPFSSERKMMSVLVEDSTGVNVYVKGAPEVVLQKCTYYMKNGTPTDLDIKHMMKLLDLTAKMAKNAFRTLVIAVKQAPSAEDRNYQEDSLIFVGLVGIEDAPREEVKPAVETAKRAGIEVKIITGDNKETAVAIGKQIGIEGLVLEGSALDRYNDDELKNMISDIKIFSRVKPEHKLRIVKALKARNEIVAMTGDGVNDAPALKEAHVGIAMGENGTDVSRAASDLIIRDNNFSTIISAVAEGRTIFNNIRKFTTYQLSCNIAELMILFLSTLFAPFFGWQLPILAAIQILFMNLVTDNLPALTLGVNPTSTDIMNDKPRLNAEILNKTLVKIIVVSGAVFSGLSLLSYYLSFNVFHLDSQTSRTTALITLILLEIVGAFNFRSFRKGTFSRSLLVNKYLFGASVASVLFTLLAVYTPANVIFSTVPVSIFNWMLAVGIALTAILIFDFSKFIFQKVPEFNSDTR